MRFLRFPTREPSLAHFENGRRLPAKELLQSLEALLSDATPNDGAIRRLELQFERAANETAADESAGEDQLAGVLLDLPQDRLQVRSGVRVDCCGLFKGTRAPFERGARLALRQPVTQSLHVRRYPRPEISDILDHGFSFLVTKLPSIHCASMGMIRSIASQRTLHCW